MFKVVAKIWKNEFFQGGIFVTASSFIVNFMNYLFNFFAGRSLGPQNYGEITTLFSYVAIVSVPTIVLSTFIIQKISSSEKNKFILTASLEKLLWQKIKTWSFMIPIFLLMTPLIPRLTNLSNITAFSLLPIILLVFLGTFYGAAMQGLRLFLLFGILGIIAALLKVSGAILVIMGLDGLYVIIFFVLLSVILPLFIAFFALRLYLQKKIRAQLPRLEKRIVSLIYNRQFLIILFSTLALTLLNNVDIVYVKKIFTAKEAGIYSSWSILAKIIFYAIGPFISISFIFFSGSKHKQADVFLISLIILIFVGLTSYYFYGNFSSLLINIFFGEKFIAVAPYLRKASLFGSLYAGIAFINSYFVAKKSLTAVILPLLLPFYLISFFFVKKHISSVMSLNIIFATAVISVYIIVLVKNLLYSNSKSTQ